MNKSIILFLLTISIGNAQTIEIKFKDFELVKNAKNVVEYEMGGSINLVIKNVNELDELLLQKKLKSRKEIEYSFNQAGYIIEKKKHANDSIFKKMYKYDADNLLQEATETATPSGIENYSAHAKELYLRIDDNVTKIWSFAKIDTVGYSEYYKTKNNYIVEEHVAGFNKLRQKIEYDKNYNRVSGLIVLASGQKLTWKNSYTFYPNGVVKSKQCISTDLKTKTTKTFFPNGLIKTEISNNRVLDHTYKYDPNGNWIYKMTYKNKNLQEVLKREITYF